MIEITAFVVGFTAMLIFMFIGLPVAVALFIIAILGCVFHLGIPSLMIFGSHTWSVLNNFILMAIPLFILLGELFVRSGSAEGMYKSLSDWLRKLPGGLLHTNVASSALFAAVSGSSVATAATIGTIAIPMLDERKYNERFTLGSIAAGATIGILIPPSINMIIYGSMSNTSIGQLFAAGLIPGIVLTVIFMIYILIACMINPSLAGTSLDPKPMTEKLRNLIDVLPPLVVFVLVMGSIYLGWATPTESAAAGVVAAFVITILKRRFSIRMLHEALLSTVKITSLILLIIIAASFLNFVIGILGIPQKLASAIGELGTSKLEIIILFILFYLILGMFLETLSMMIATIPITVPIVQHFGIDPVWFGIFLVIMMEVALITPPLGINLYIVHGVRRKMGSIMDVMVGALPFVGSMLLLVVILIKTRS